nr:MAG TPA: hypothetical protein [Ackermannviridae sp.]
MLFCVGYQNISSFQDWLSYRLQLILLLHLQKYQYSLLHLVLQPHKLS